MTSTLAEESESRLIAGRFVLGQKIGGSSEVFAGVECSSGRKVAIKREPVDRKYPELVYEYRAYRRLNRKQADGFLRMHFYGRDGDFEYLVLEMGGPNLKDLFLSCQRRLSLKTVLMLGIQLLDRIEYVHSLGYIFRKLKPRDFLMGSGSNSHRVFPIDFALFKRFRDPETGEHIPYREKREIMARVKYASIEVNFGVESSRRDDLESLGYMLIYFMRGRLPWSEEARVARDDEGDLAVARKKEQVTLKELCRGLPREFEQYLRYVRGLHFSEQPDYGFCRNLFHGCFARMGYQWDDVYDWSQRQFNRVDPNSPDFQSSPSHHP
eukprot:CAMPEP_0196654580 /NCGR_PEP_ID=MMETSP1086-20130531/4309_1 /TAXON_ID=77921 /ORGANISM="Cyanoptyche  gloeocystis , Strain SAG4.97" /LENGTH=323 /DNA_ID=CAMNT_0041986431 /DNA_START=83 /DNA_END=1051 /DNA_ORIENTATION=-